MITLDAKIRHVLSRLRDERGLGSRTLLAREAAALIEQLDAMRIKAALNPQEAQWLANAERQREEIDKSEVEFFEKLRASPAEREETERAETERDALQKVLHTIWENPTTASWILELIEASGAIAAPQ